MLQPNLFSSESPHGSAAEPVRADASARDAGIAAAKAQSGNDVGAGTRGAVWLRRIELFLRVIVRFYLGLLLVALPWMHFWSENRFFTLYAPLGTFAESGAVRGIVSGVGLLNLWIALSEAFHYRDSGP